jgi:PAS domain S-box-containing protein
MRESGSEAQFEALLETAPDAIIAVTEDGRIALVNRQAEVTFGYAREELLGQGVEMLVPDSARAIHSGHREAYFRRPATRPMGAVAGLVGRRKDGAEFPVEISLSGIRTGDGLLVSAAIRDVTEGKRAEAKFRGLLEAAPDAILGVDAHGRIVLANGRAEQLFGYPMGELLNQPIEMLVPDRFLSRHPLHRTRYGKELRPRPMGAGTELAGRRKDGSEFPAEISLSAIETQDGLIVSAAVRDVTERIEARGERERLRSVAEREGLEAQLHQSQRLESLGQLAGGVAHDFNNLLAVILNYASFVSEKVQAAAAEPAGAHWEPVCHDMEQIRRAAERATALTHQLLAFGRREVVRPQTLNLNDVINGLEPLLRRTLGEHMVLTIDLFPDLQPVTVDPGQLEQVLVNLAVNARDAMPGGGELTVKTQNTIIDDTYGLTYPDVPPGSYVRLEVSDTGQGMSRANLVRAFEPFFTTKPKGEGSGLGLATVYGIVTQAGGHARIYSEEGIGTTFRALLPISAGVMVKAEPRSVPRPGSRGGETILLVEDEEAMREVSRRILSRAGYQVLTAGGGDEALEVIAQYPDRIHLLLTDVIMPRMLGKEVAEQVSHAKPGIRVIFMSGYAMPVLASGGRLDPGVRLVEKPFSEVVLLDAVRDVLDAE